MKLKLLMILSLFALHGIANSVRAAEADKTYSFVVWTHGGEQFSYSLDTKPVVTYDDGYINVTTSTGEGLSLEAEEVAQFTLSDEAVDDDTTTSLESAIAPQGEMKSGGDVLAFSAFEPGTRVHIYSVSGTLMTSGVIGSDGCLVISISDYSSGIYVVKTKGLTCKIIKK